MTPRYFDSANAWRTWLEANHATASELLVGFHKRHTARPSLSWRRLAKLIEVSAKQKRLDHLVPRAKRTP
jgi:hypothetical protein